MTRRRWIAEQWDEATAFITGAQAEHLARVLRAQPGMEADVLAGGHVFHAEVAAVTPSEVRFNLVTEVQADPALPVTLVMAVYKFDRMEWAIEKATELGVAAIAPVIAQRTEKHLAQADRWFEKHGEATVFFSRMLPIIRTFISLPAGVARMPFWRFSLFTFLGCIPWVFMLTFIGKEAGDNWDKWKDKLHYVDYAVAAAIVVAAGDLFIRWRRNRNAGPTDTAATASENV